MGLAPRTFAVLLALAGSAADIIVSRTIEAAPAGSGTLTLDGSSCTGSDAFGSNNCDLHWGSSYTGKINATLSKDIEQGSTISVDAHVDTFIPFKVSCPVCGANCTITIPIVKKTISVTMPPCPISAQSLSQPFQFTLPSSSPVPIKASAKGEATVTDASGAVLLKASFEATVSPSAIEAELGQCEKVPYDFCCGVGTPCDCTKGTTAPGQCKPESYVYCCNVGTPCDCSQPPAL